MSNSFDAYHKWLGIPPEEQPPTHYRLLGLRAFESDPDVIEGAADRQMSHIRSFQTGKHAVLSQQLLNELSAAKLCLLHRKQKAAYDAALRAAAGAPTESPADVPAAAIPEADPQTGHLAADASHLAAQFDGTVSRGSARQVRARKKSNSSALALGALALVACVGLAGLAVVVLGKKPASTAATGGASNVVSSTPDDEEDGPPSAGPDSTDDADPRVPHLRDGESESFDDASDELPIPGLDPDDEGELPVPESDDDTMPVEPVEETSQRPIEQAPPPENAIYLSDLPPREVRILHCDSASAAADAVRAMVFSTNRDWVGDLAGDPLVWMHPPGAEFVPAHVAFDLDGRYRRFRGTVLISDVPLVGEGAGAPLVFRIVGDGEERWKSQALQARAASETFDVDIAGVEQLELFVEPQGGTFAAYAVWHRPLLVPAAADGPAIGELVPSDGRAQPPDEADRAAAMKELKQRFGAELSAKESEERLKAARGLLAEAEKSETGEALAYVMLTEAADLAVLGGDYWLAVEIVNSAASRWSIAAPALKFELLSRWQRSQKGTEGKAAVAEAAWRLMSEAAVAGDYDTADKAASQAASAATASKEKTLAERVKSRAGQVRELTKAWTASQAAFETLESAPDDAEASRTAGEFLCFFRGDWATGLPLLAAGDEPKLTAVAALDLAAPDDPQTQATLAEAWASAAGQLKEPARSAAHSRAVYWFEQALNSDPGAGKDSWRRRRDELADRLVEGPPGRWLADYARRLEVAEEVECSGAPEPLDVPAGFDLARDWDLSFQFRTADLRPSGLLFFWGDGRGGHDPLYVQLEVVVLRVSVSDTTDADHMASFDCPLLPEDRWRSIHVFYRARDRSVSVSIDGSLATTGTVPFDPQADQPMPVLLGGDSPDGEGFTGRLRAVVLANSGQ
jgi:hypothetical protein